MNGAYSARAMLRRQGRTADPRLVETIVALVGGESVIDLGAGNGRYVTALREVGIDAIGVDAAPGIEELTGGLVLHGDLSSPDWKPPRRFSWAICIEVGEHVPPERQDAFLDSLATAAPNLLLSWATPGQRGRGHCCCRTPEEVTALLEARGMALDAASTRLARLGSGGKWAEKLLVLRRSGASGGVSVLRVRLPGIAEPVAAVPVEARGDRILVKTPEGHRLVGAENAVSLEEFAAAWRRLGGGRQGLTFEDGTPWEPF